MIQGLTDVEGANDAKDALRGLIEKIVLVPVDAEGDGTRLAIDLHGALAGLLRLATGQPLHAVAQTQKAPRTAGCDERTDGRPADTDLQAADLDGELVLVAGTRNYRYRHSLQVAI